MQELISSTPSQQTNQDTTIPEQLLEIRLLAYELQKKLRALPRPHKDLLHEEGLFGMHRRYLGKHCWDFIFAINRLRAKSRNKDASPNLENTGEQNGSNREVTGSRGAE